MSLNYTGLIERFFSTEGRLEALGDGFIITRTDGIPIYQWTLGQAQNDVNTFGALIGGIWNAAEGLSLFLPESKDDIFRLSFDTSSKGIYILKARAFDMDLYVGLLYTGALNPGKIKSQLRELVRKLEDFLSENRPVKKEKKETQGIFTDITDDEVDGLFNIFDH